MGCNDSDHISRYPFGHLSDIFHQIDNYYIKSVSSKKVVSLSPLTTVVIFMDVHGVDIFNVFQIYWRIWIPIWPYFQLPMLACHLFNVNEQPEKFMIMHGNNSTTFYNHFDFLSTYLTPFSRSTFSCQSIVQLEGLLGTGGFFVLILGIR